jgi:hypothetical protein
MNTLASIPNEDSNTRKLRVRLQRAMRILVAFLL